MKTIVKALLAASIAVLLVGSGCLFGPKEGMFQLKASDAPGDIDDFLAVLVKVPNVYIHRDGQPGGEATEGNETGPGWIKVAIPFSKQTVDLLKIIDGDTWEFFNKSLEPGKYTQVRLQIASAKGTLKNGTQIDVDAPKTMKFVKPFDISAGQTTTFVADVNVVRVGDSEYRVQPNLGNTKVMGPA